MSANTEEFKNIIINNNKQKIDIITQKKMFFIFNALNKGWIIKKNQDKYIFYKKHNNEKCVFSDSYLTTFMKENFSQ
tara:strand:+ start:1597 stop:1827 length:231 start_codon:yes stop_codon:yes gene_type:complete